MKSVRIAGIILLIQICKLSPKRCQLKYNYNELEYKLLLFVYVSYVI